MKNNSSPWLIFDETRKDDNAKMRLFCFHYAGAGASTFQNWIRSMPDAVELVGIQLPGREKRFYEPLISDIQQITTALAKELIPFLDKPFAFFGHSIGALISFDLARVLRKQGMTQPELLIVSGRNAPQIKLEGNKIHLLPDDEFAQTVRGYNGCLKRSLKMRSCLNCYYPACDRTLKLGKPMFMKTRNR